MMDWTHWAARWSDGYFGFHAAMHLIWYAAVIGFVAFIVFYLTKRSAKTDDRPRALDVLKERYAKGDLSKDDFDRMRKDILV
jgi:putative membrane protein